jgi:hypothetical protein
MKIQCDPWRFLGDEFLSPNHKNFCQQAENDRKEVAAAITPLCGYPG